MKLVFTGNGPIDSKEIESPVVPRIGEQFTHEDYVGIVDVVTYYYGEYGLQCVFIGYKERIV